VFTEDGVLKKELPRMPRSSELSPDGSRLLEVRFTNGRSDLFVSDADGSHARRVVRGVSFEDEAHWSHDGKRILYASSRGGYHVFEADARGNVLRRLARGDGVSEPAYTPDGRVSYILWHFPKEQRPPHSDDFVIIKKHLPADIVVTDGATESVVVEGRLLRSYAWEPSGQRLAFGTYEDDGLIVTRDLAGGTERVVKLSDIDKRLGGFVAHDIRWRPDGGAVAFTLSFTGGSEKGAKALFGEKQLFVLYPDGHATWFDVEKTYLSFDWIPADADAR
jgi:Tol biopolymer transport system component